MKIFLRSLEFLSPFKLLIAVVVITNMLFAALETAVVAIIYPLLQLLFRGDYSLPDPAAHLPAEAKSGVLATITDVLSGLKDAFYASIQSVVAADDPTTRLLNLSLFIIGLFLLKNITKYFASVYSWYLGESITKRIRDRLYAKLMSLSQSYFSGSKSGFLLSSFANDIPEMNRGLMIAVSSLIRQPLQIIFPLYLVLSFSAYLTATALGAGVLSVIFIQLARKHLRRYSSRLQTALADVTNHLQESIIGIRIIRAFGAERTMQAQFEKHTAHFVRSHKKMQHVEQLVPAVNEMFAMGALATVLFVGGSEVAAGTMAGEELMTFLFLLFNMMGPAVGMSAVIAQLQRGIVAAERVYSVLDTPPQLSDGAREFPKQWQSLEFHNVSFAYGEKPAVTDVSFALEKSKTIALVGHSGSGKSTTADLLIRFYDPTEGSITLDGVPVQSFRQREYRNLFGVVSQEPLLFNGSIADNVRFGRDEVSQADIQQALRLAHAQEFVEALPEGIDTHIGDRGTMLSGGQRQRIAIARALAANPDILIFDEATSALDSESERQVQLAITDALQDRTAVIIAHRLSTILHADEILVFDAGKVVERGTHAALLAYGGTYKKLFDIQFGDNSTAARKM